MSKSDWLREQREAQTVETTGTEGARCVIGDRSRVGRQQQGLPAPRLRRESGGVTPTAQKTQAVGSRRAEVQGCAPVAKGVEGPPLFKVGRPRLEDKAKTLQATKPWIAAGMSERTWYRRRAEKRAS